MNIATSTAAIAAGALPVAPTTADTLERRAAATVLEANPDAELLRLDASDEAKAHLLRLRGHEAALLASDLGLLRRTVEIAADNLGRSLDRSQLMDPGGLFGDDASLADAFLERLDDQIAYLGLRTDAAKSVLGIRDLSATDLSAAEPPRAGTRQATRSSAHPDPRPGRPNVPPTYDRSRQVFVIHGRDEPARVAVFDLLRAYGLHPVEWDESVRDTGEPMPFLGQVLETSMPLVQAVVAVMTPDDVVRLHPELHRPNEPRTETRDAMQARANVLIELGMALAVHPKRTVMLIFGDQKPIADIGGRNYVLIAEDLDFRTRLGNRLILAGCPVRMPEGGAWRTAGDFSSLAAYQRAPRRKSAPS